MQYVFVVDIDRKPCNPAHPGEARRLLSAGRAAVLRRFPFTIVLKDRSERDAQPLRIKIDPGSKVTGMAIVGQDGRVLFAAEIHHKGQRIRNALLSRRALRRGRRSRKTRYRAPRFLNRTRPPGWLPPSLESRVVNVETWVRRIGRAAKIDFLSMELVKFDLQRMENPEIAGVEYQQGELAGYEVREYLLEKWNRTCAYCGAENVPLQIEHIVSKSKGGSNRVSNLTLACEPCNEKKSDLDVREFLKHDQKRLENVLAQAKTPLKDAAAVNATRWVLYDRLKATGLPVECGSGGRTKFNRTRLGLPKAHWIDAACVGESGGAVSLDAGMFPLRISANGHGNRRMCGTDKHGFPIRHRGRQKQHFGFQTGDLVRAIVPTGKKTGSHVGRALCRAAGSFDIQTGNGRVTGISHKRCAPIHRKDGYAYA